MLLLPLPLPLLPPLQLLPLLLLLLLAAIALLRRVLVRIAELSMAETVEGGRAAHVVLSVLAFAQTGATSLCLRWRKPVDRMTRLPAAVPLVSDVKC